jgi:drug/metabolite transporter (DMT)-like permease
VPVRSSSTPSAQQAGAASTARETPGAPGAKGTRSAGLALALLSALAFGGSGTAAKPLINAGLPPLQMVWLRVTGAALVLLPVALRHSSVLRRRPGLLLGFGIFAVAGVQACYFGAISRIPVGVALLIEYLGPVLLLGWVRLVQKRHVTRAAAVGAAIALAGMACVVQVWSGFGGMDPLGVLLAFGAACCQVCYFLFSDAGSGTGPRSGGPAADSGTGTASDPGSVPASGTAEPADVEPLAVAGFGLAIGAVALTPLAHPWTLHWALLGRRVAMGEHVVPAALLLAWVVLVATVLAYITGVTAVRLLSPPVAGVVACLEAVVATVLAWILLGERLDTPQLLGGLLVVLGALAAQTSASPRRRRSENN